MKHEQSIHAATMKAAAYASGYHHGVQAFADGIAEGPIIVHQHGPELRDCYVRGARAAIRNCRRAAQQREG